MRSYIDLNDPALENAIRKYLDPDDPLFNQLKYCGLGFVGFNSNKYPADATHSIAADVASAAKTAFDNLKTHIGNRVAEEQLATFDLHLVCMPFNSINNFRSAFLKELGLSNA